MRRFILLFTILFASTPNLVAGDLDTISLLPQGAFKAFSEDVAAMASYKGVIPAEGLGTLGFDVSLVITGTQLENVAAWELAAGGSSFSDTLPVPKLVVHKGLPFNFDIGGFLATAPDSNIKLYGAEVRYGIIGGNVALPAVAVRLSYSQLTGVDELDFDTTGLDVSVSKGFAILTPYAGLGKVWANSDPKGLAAVTLTGEELSLSKIYAGANLNMGLLNFALEVDKTGDATSASLKFGFRF